jgi:hypothetical protein
VTVTIGQSKIHKVSSSDIPLDWSRRYKTFFHDRFVAAAKEDRAGIVDFCVTEEAAWTANDPDWPAGPGACIM